MTTVLLAKRPPRKPRKAPKKRPPPSVDFHKEAVEWFKERVPMRKEEWLELDRVARLRAFTVARVAQLSIINETLKALTKAIAAGESFQTFKAAVSERLEKAWGETRAWHVEVIYRNNMQQAYSHGRNLEQRRPETLQMRPYWLFSSILDDRTTEVCRRANGTVLPAEHPWWTTHTPPCHHQCRSMKRALTERQARQRGITTAKRVPEEESQEGFGGADALAWKPDLTDVDARLVKAYRRKSR